MTTITNLDYVTPTEHYTESDNYTDAFTDYHSDDNSDDFSQNPAQTETEYLDFEFPTETDINSEY